MEWKHNKNVFLAGCLVSAFCFSVLGCDMISSIKETLSSEKQQKTTATQNVKKETKEKKKQEKRKGPLPPDVVARVGDWSITAKELKDRILAEKAKNPDAKVDINSYELKKAVLDVLIRQQLLMLDAKEKGLDKKEEVKKAIEDIERTILVQAVVSDIIKNIDVSDEEAKKAYDTINSPYFYEPLEVKVREIVVDSKVKATELLLEIQKGADFAEMAKQHSIGDTASKGGDLGFIKEPPFPKMGDVILSMLEEKDNDISMVFKGPKGFYIIKIEEKRGGEKKPFEELKDFIKEQLSLEKSDAALLEYVAGLEKKYNVETNEGLLKQETK